MTIPPDKTDKIDATQQIAPSRPAAPTGPQGGFQSYMQGSAQGTQGVQGAPSPAELPQGPSSVMGRASMDSLIGQVSTMQDSMGNLNNQLNTTNLRLTRSQQHLLRNKLSDASTYLRAANGKLGIDAPPMPVPNGSGPINKFLNYVADGENQLNAAKQQISDLSKNGAQLRPADMLLIQIKLNQAQQEIEYSSTLLGKVISSFTQVLNTQL